jgi:hypothetical protein
MKPGFKISPSAVYLPRHLARDHPEVLQRYERYYITRRAASISIFAEPPCPSSATTATVIGETMRPALCILA